MFTDANHLPDDVRSSLIDAGWTPPIDVNALLADEREHVADMGVRGAYGHGDGDTTPVYVLAKTSGATVFAVQRTTYQESVEDDLLHDLLGEGAADAATVTFTLLADA